MKSKDKILAHANRSYFPKKPLTTTENPFGSGLGTIATPIINEIVRRPEAVRQADQIVNSSSKEVKLFYAGCEYGHTRGFDAGYGKGMLVGILGAFLVLNLTQKQ